MEINDNLDVQVINLLGCIVVYTIPEDNIRRVFGGYEVKKIKAGELRKLFYQQGGAYMLQNCLSVRNKNLAAEFGISEDSYDHEYTWTQEQVDNVLLNGSLDELLDALDFAPTGIIDMIVDRAVALKIVDISKRDAITKATGRDINSQIAMIDQLESNLEEENVAEPNKTRRVAASVNEKNPCRRA